MLKLTILIAILFGISIAACKNPVGPPPPEPRIDSVSVSPETAALQHGQTQQFTSMVHGQDHDQSGVWSTLYGEISNGGLYTAPQNDIVDTVTYTSSMDATKSGFAVVTVVPPPNPVIAFYSRRGKSSVLCSGVCGSIYIMDSDGSNIVRLTFDTPQDIEPTWFPDGERIAFTRSGTCSNGAHSIFLMKLDGTNLVNATQCLISAQAPSVSPDGRLISFSYFDIGIGPREAGIAVIGIDGSDFRKFTSIVCDGGCSPDHAPNWSPDGTRIAFVSNRDGGWEIYTMRPDGTNQVRVTYNEWPDAQPRFSPDGKYIAFASKRDDNVMQIYTINADGTGETRLTQDNVGAIDPTWSPDGSRIAYTGGCCDAGTMDIYVMNADGTNPVNITNTPFTPEGFPAWRPQE